MRHLPILLLPALVFAVVGGSCSSIGTLDGSAGAESPSPQESAAREGTGVAEERDGADAPGADGASESPGLDQETPGTPDAGDGGGAAEHGVEVVSDTPGTFGSTIERPYSPVVVEGSKLPAVLRGVPPDSIVAFRWEGATGRWVQVPAQVDERAVKEFYDIYGRVSGCPHNFALPGPSLKALVYTDPSTYTGPDPDPTMDADDELVFMARDLGGKPSSWHEPAGVIAGSGVELVVSDPLDSGAAGWLYLFRHDGSLKPDAGKSYVSYRFQLKSGDYKKTYNRCGNKSTKSPANPEDSTIRTVSYTRHFSDRWITDQLKILPPLGSGVDLLDMNKALFSPGACSRSVVTFSSHEGAFVANKSGPVRGIRSYSYRISPKGLFDWEKGRASLHLYRKCLG